LGKEFIHFPGQHIKPRDEPSEDRRICRKLGSSQLTKKVRGGGGDATFAAIRGGE